MKDTRPCTGGGPTRPRRTRGITAGAASALAVCALAAAGCTLVCPPTPVGLAHAAPGDSGLVVEDLIVGDGAPVTGQSTIVASMTGRLENGDVFHETTGPAGPWAVADLVPGLAQGLQGMATGGTRRVTIPAALAYGDASIFEPTTGRILIPSGSTIVYEVTLVEVACDDPPDDRRPQGEGR